MRVFLIGFMGCGKSTLGKKLAKKLNLNFIDMDHAIEEQEGMTINEIFSSKGENNFRKIENEYLASFETENVVVGTGGGAPCYYNNIDLINELGCSVYIKLPPKVLKDRLKGETNKRPLVQNMSDEELLSFIEVKLNEREVYYNNAHVIFDGLKFDIPELVLEIQSQIFNR